MNKLEVGMYVRSKINGMIGKITDIEETKVFDSYLTVIREETRYILDNNSNRGFCETEKDSVIASNNIIDLIEVGDVITTNNLCGQVTCIEGDKIYTTCYDGECCYDYQIQSIVTKEQFSSMEYRLGE